MKLEHIALLAHVGDSDRSDMWKAAGRLRAVQVPELSNLLDEVYARVKVGRFDHEADEIQRLLLTEALEDGKFGRYLRAMEDYSKRGVKIISYWDRDYPESLRGIGRPPLLLYVRGRVFPGNSPIAIAGTRRASKRGIELAVAFAKHLTGRGHTIVSGLAWGVDSAAHRGALEAGGTTLGILAGHIDHVYPKQNLALAEEMVKHGSLVSEITKHASIHRGRFVERNRITSGVSRAVVVIECNKRGGTLHQAKFAIRQGRPTYVADHRNFEKVEAQEGFERLKSLGAVPVELPSEIDEP